METILNLIWLLIAGLAFGAYCIWAAGLPRLARSRRRKREVALVLVCLLALLLPIISVTDDLTFDLATLDQWTAARRVSSVLLTMVVAQLAGGLASLAEAGAEVHRAVLRLASAGVDELPALFVLSPSIVTVWSFRAPPRAVS